ncbi:hypothetical protein G6O67_005617 [Ophiocordyceps sinensis]|uniref:Uncharacterized protein n=2 Tax=Ophiocordyceps sinensis TaxID=72228 RepID=A0A8H4PLH5_9HYPO|nr:hypothetical protein OCS_02225 [Ophiocordyceps sinensis CO18]KAF4506932.1 hypothetical protein G6O67_005617 [Ophiocordyceps sinensis]
MTLFGLRRLFGLHRTTSSSCDRGESSHAPREQQLPRDSEVPPPSYVAVTDSEKKSETAASSGKALDEKNTPVNLQIIFLPDTNCTSSLDLDWEAYLYVQSRDIAGLMKEGFHFSEANVQHDRGFFILDKASIPENAKRNGWNCIRFYHLTHKPEHGDVQWIATLYVLARDISVLSNFRLQQISADKIRSTNAWNLKRQLIYGYDAKYVEQRFNAILDDQPLEGCWPSWPKKQ